MARYKTKTPPRKAQKNRLIPHLFQAGLVLAGVGLLAAALWALFGATSRPQTAIEVSGAPSLQVDREVIDYGDVKLGTPVQAAVRVTNVGDQTLRFTEAPYVEVLEGC